MKPLQTRAPPASGGGRGQEGYLARISLSWATSRSESSWLRWKTFRPKIRPVAPASIDWLAFSSMASSPACFPPETRGSERLADLTAASMTFLQVGGPDLDPQRSRPARRWQRPHIPNGRWWHSRAGEGLWLTPRRDL